MDQIFKSLPSEMASRRREERKKHNQSPVLIIAHVHQVS